MTLALLITAVTGAWAQDTYNVTFKANDKTVTKENITLPHTFGCNWDDEYARGTDELDQIIQELYGLSGGSDGGEEFPTSDNASVTCGKSDFQYITISAPFEGTATVTGIYLDGDYKAFNYSLEITCVAPAADPTIDVTTNAAKEGDPFTEAKFNMPAFDATVNYELVRDMSIQMTATMGDGTDGVRYRVKKAQQGEGYEPADMNMMQVLALVAVNDGIEQKALTLDQDYYCRIYKLDEQTQQPAGDGVELIDFDFAPGLYALKAFAKDDSDYAGETALSNTFTLFQGYEVTVPAKEYITYYKDEPLYVEDEDALLYTITSVTDTEAVLSEKSDAMPSNTPMLVYNKSNETKTILLIPCAEPDMAITVAPEFKGSITSGVLPASSSTADYYALNGKAFVWVKYAIEIGANKCWLQIGNQPAAARAMTRSIVGGGDTTGIDAIENVTIDNEGWYDMQGRKLQAKPNRGGIYIHNGKKVVVRK